MLLKDRYYIGAIGCSLYGLPGAMYYYDQSNNNWANFDELYFSFNHQYLPGNMNWNYEQSNPPMIGAFYDNINSYMVNLSNIFKWSNQKLILERFRTNFAGFGQRSTYQAEEFYEGTGLKWIAEKPGYGYSIHETGTDFFDNTQSPPVRVRKCIAGTDVSNKYIVHSLFENCEQVNNTGTDLRFSDTKPDLNPPYRWYIKPRIRINRADTIYPNKEVVKIETYAYNGTLIGQPVPIIVSDFFDEKGHYDGNYKEYFLFQNNPTTYPLSVSGTSLNLGNNGNMYNSKVDYRVWWSGQVDVYLDYVRVDDEWAHFLFNPALDKTHKWDLVSRIDSEVIAFNQYSSFGQFYLDEFQYNNIDCIVKTKEIIESASNGRLTLVPIFNYNGIDALSLRNLLKYDDDCIDDLIKKGLYKDFIRYDVYPFSLSPFWLAIQYPHNLTFDVNLGGNIHPHIKELFNKNRALNSEQYNDTLEDKLEYCSLMDGNNYQISQMYAFRMSGKALVKAREQGNNLILSYTDQIHALDFDTQENGYVLREPTNEEISLEVFLGLVYGSKQTIHYEYNDDAYHINGYDFHQYGLASANGTHRTKNVYQYSNGDHQNKWDGVRKTDSALAKIGDYMYPPGHPEKHMYYIETKTVNTFPPIRNLSPYFTDTRGLKNPVQYISDIKSIYRNSDHNYNDTTLHDALSKRYWEIGFFENNPDNPDFSNEKYDRYFIAVNKRCTPESPGNQYDGDLRKLIIKFYPNSPALAGFTDWKLIDPLTSITIATFNKTQWVDAGIFQPGEGKIFKITPVINEGGTLDGNEELGSVKIEDGNVSIISVLQTCYFIWKISI